MFEKLLVLKGGRVEEDLHALEAIGLDAKLCQVGLTKGTCHFHFGEEF
jgi:hypothetical protein